MIVRWIFADPDSGDSVVLPLNPNQMSSPTTPRNIQWAWGSYWGQDRMRGFEAPPQSPTTLTFGGVILTKSHYDILLLWAGKLIPIHMTDHLGRTFEIVISKYSPIERLPTSRRDWRADYTMECMLIGEVA